MVGARFLGWSIGLIAAALAVGGCLPGDGSPSDPLLPAPAAPDPGPPADAPTPDAAPPSSPTGAQPAPAADAPTRVPAPVEAVAPEPEPEPAAEAPEPAATPLEALIFLQPASVAQGQVFLVAVDTANASTASIALGGQFISLTREGDRFFTILPAPVDQEPGPLSMLVAVADATGELVLQEVISVQVVATDFPVEAVEIDATLQRLLNPAVAAEDRALRESVQRVKSPRRLWTDFFSPPTDGIIASSFGVLRSYNGAAPSDYHTGMDLAGALGTEVRAPNGAVVAWVGETERRGRGVILDHGGGLFTSYWHLSNASARTGTTVARGAVIGRVGNTGLSTGSHLHWEVVVHGVPVDPLPWLRALEVPKPAAVFDPLQAVNARGPVVAGPSPPATPEAASAVP